MLSCNVNPHDNVTHHNTIALQPTHASPLETDRRNLPALLEQARVAANAFFDSLETRAVIPAHSTLTFDALPNSGVGAAQTLERFLTEYSDGLTASAGARYLGFVTGGATPAALIGDWLCSAFDQNGADSGGLSTQLEHATIRMLLELFGLPQAFTGSFVSGATMSNFVGMAQARQWIGEQHGVDIASSGLYRVPPLEVLTATAHSSLFKTLSMLGMGRGNVQTIACLPGREAMDVNALQKHLEQRHSSHPCIVVASSGTVNTTDFDDLEALVALKAQYDFWLHVDAAFGGFAATSPRYAHLIAGMAGADSITIDAHKWLNVPYDSAIQLTRHQDLQLRVFQNSGAAYLGAVSPEFVHLTPENSRRFRALPAWFTLHAYGRDGYREIIERDCQLAAELGQRIAASDTFELLASVRLNVVCFKPRHKDVSAFLAALRSNGEVFMTPTTIWGQSAARAAFSNWRSGAADLERVWAAMQWALL